MGELRYRHTNAGESERESAKLLNRGLYVPSHQRISKVV
jgi:hypothetical protein